MAQQEELRLTAGKHEEKGEEEKIRVQHLMDDKEGNTATMMHTLKGFVNSGILALPFAVKNAGLWTGTICLACLGLINAAAMQQLVYCRDILSARLDGTPLEYAEVMEQAIIQGPPGARKYSKFGLVIVNIMICIAQVGFCSVYLIFAAENANKAMAFLFDIELGKINVMIIMSFVLLPIVFLKSLKILAPVSTFANVLHIVGLIVVLQFCLSDLLPTSSLPAFTTWKQIPVFFSISIFAFEGIGVVLPVQNKMKTPEDFWGLTGVLNTAQMLITILYTTLGFYGYLRVGNEIKGSITLNLPTDTFHMVTIALFALSMLLSYALQYYVLFHILWPVIEYRLPINCSHGFREVGVYLFKTALVGCIFLFSSLIPHMDLVISLMGSLSNTVISFIFPPVIDTLMRWEHWDFGTFNWRLAKSVFFFVFGLIGFSVGTVVSIINIATYTVTRIDTSD